ncbi:vacuolar protein sorting-associated protein 60.1-like [Raphanus sativus]|uniref:Vacuolar protein sorting-associated protein 60.1-like n=1 Tax=Raphanus sativus TaxID=3726 RepID=A0A9W3DL94_RAPSA|nr:vacuolar protein sorting-associated protein 60.1-like [Raphanus sativus]
MSSAAVPNMRSAAAEIVAPTSFDDLRLGRSGQFVVGRLLRFWDSRNIKKQELCDPWIYSSCSLRSLPSRYEGQRDMLYNQTFNLDQVSFADEGLKDAQQTMTALKSANKELKGMMKTVQIQDIDNLQYELMDLMDVSSEIQETLGRSYNVPDGLDEDDLMEVLSRTNHMV